MITPAQRAEIRRLFYGEHWKVGTIAAQLGLHRETVRAAVERETAGVRPSLCRPSILDPYLPFIRDTLAQYPRLRATRIHEMVRQRGYAGSVFPVRRLVRRLRPESGRAVYRRVVTLVGEQAGLSRPVHGRAAGAVGQGNPRADGGHEEPSAACRLRVRTGRHGLGLPVQRTAGGLAAGDGPGPAYEGGLGAGGRRPVGRGCGSSSSTVFSPVHRHFRSRTVPFLFILRGDRAPDSPTRLFRAASPS